jgi:hypothetical protein
MRSANLLQRMTRSRCQRPSNGPHFRCKGARAAAAAQSSRKYKARRLSAVSGPSQMSGGKAKVDEASDHSVGSRVR